MATYTDPTTIIPSTGAKRLETGAALGLVAGIVAVLTAGLFFYGTQAAKAETAKVDEKSQAVQAEINSLGAVSQQLVQMDAHAKNLHTVFDNQVRWNSVLEGVQKRLYRNMAVVSMQLSSDGKLVFKGYAPSYLDYAKLYRSLTDSEGQKYFSDVRPSAIEKTRAAGGSEVVNFVFSLRLTPELMPVQSVDSSATAL